MFLRRKKIFIDKKYSIFSFQTAKCWREQRAAAGRAASTPAPTASSCVALRGGARGCAPRHFAGDVGGAAPSPRSIGRRGATQSRRHSSQGRCRKGSLQEYVVGDFETDVMERKRRPGTVERGAAI